jgi:hypothetical protein
VARGKDKSSPTKKDKKANDENPVSEVIGLVRTYAKQEAIGPLANALRWLAWGAIGALFLAIGFALGLLALLRVLQTETGDAFDGNWSWVPYILTIVAAALVLGVTVSRIKKPTLDKEGSGR